MLYLVKVGPDSLPDNDFSYLPCVLIGFPLSQGMLFELVLSRWWFICSVPAFVPHSDPYCASKWLTSSPATTHLLSVDGASVMHIVTSSALMTTLAC